MEPHVSQSIPFSMFTVHVGLDVVVVQDHDHLALVELERVEGLGEAVRGTQPEAGHFCLHP